MSEQDVFHTRRGFMRSMTLGAFAFTVPGVFAQHLVQTPATTAGPFYPDHLLLDTDNDLLIINDRITPAVGEITYVSGRLLGAGGNPIRNAVIEIWQADINGVYLHTGSKRKDIQDKNFQGFGRFLTGSSGEYLFRTIKPVPYENRARHIHFAVKIKGREQFMTQLYVKGEPMNDNDNVLKRITNPRAREAVIVDFAPVKGSRIGELAARFDIIMGFTPEA